ncbi:hypothetical protein K7432_017696 [Basidiobolus ranarum]|uniref:Hyaluronan/mRNA-binding protein domain-containing protein n=1 Tax=Basidiobolus ranarum TaxID=34480 RepID=A0ABR2WD24_9FUNG
MTRSRRSTNPSALIQDHHISRTGYQDARGLPKKEGGGGFNWGRSTDELEDINLESLVEPQAIARKRSMSDSKLHVVDSQLFDKINGEDHTGQS